MERTLGGGTRPACLFVAALALAASSPAWAQEPETNAPPLPPPSSESIPPADARAEWRCGLGDHAGVDENDAKTAASLVCGEVARVGAAPGGEYRVGLGKLGSMVVLSLESSVNGARDQRQIQLASIEEVAVAAPRVAEALVHGTPIAQTQKIDNLVSAETRTPKKKPGSVHFGVGVLGVTPPIDRLGAPVPGFEMELHYEASQMSAGVGTRFAWGTPSDTNIDYAGLDVRGHYYLFADDVTPYIGAGLAWTGLILRGPDFSGKNDGIGAFGEIGVEALRSHTNHLTLGLRLDVPFYSLRGDAPTTRSSATRYYMPATIALSFVF